jgi:hypothetical protein
MAELKTKPTSIGVKDYISTLPADIQPDCKKLDLLCKKVIGKPGVMWGSAIAGYGQYHYKYPSGQEGDWFYLGFSSRKQNITLYMMCGFDHNKQLVQKLGKYKLGKSCLYIKKVADVDEKVLLRIMEEGYKKMKAL